ncbi:MAG TPA: hypothetical protein VFE62_26005 [Gemmataceae bacterium]|nr:hypothetical protein [Gemmataceae bacterium]
MREVPFPFDWGTVMKSRACVVVGVIGFGVVLLLASHQLREVAVTFESMTEAYDDFLAMDYACCSDRRDGIVDYGFMVSKDPATWRDAGTLCKVGPMQDNWKNKVWIAPLRPDISGTMPSDADMRIWGGVYAFGDSDFLSELEHGWRQKRGLLVL